MTGPDIPTRVYRIVSLCSGIPEDRINPSHRIGFELDVDSLAIHDLALRVEEEFGVLIGDEDLSPASTVADLVTLVERKAVGAAA